MLHLRNILSMQNRCNWKNVILIPCFSSFEMVVQHKINLSSMLNFFYSLSLYFFSNLLYLYIYDSNTNTDQEWQIVYCRRGNESLSFKSNGNLKNIWRGKFKLKKTNEKKKGIFHFLIIIIIIIIFFFCEKKEEKI